MTGLTPATAADFAPTAIYTNTVDRDPLAILPERAADRLRALRQRFHDTNTLIPKFEEIREANATKIEAGQRLKRLLDHQSVGGFHLPETDPRVIEQRRLLDKLTDDARRLTELQAKRSQVWHAASHVLTAVEGWLKDGIPPGVVLEDHEVEVPKPNKGEGIVDAIDRLRRRGRELRADLHRIRSAPYPSSHAKAQMRAQIEALAMQGAPDVADLIEHDRKLVFKTQRLQSSVYNTNSPALAFAELEAAIPLLIWLHKDAMIAALDREIDTEADDPAALTHEARQQQEAVVMSDLLSIEYDEAALVWRAMDERLPVEHRADCAAQCILQVRLVTAPRVNGARGSSPMHAWDIVMPGRR
jgi:hypothetical protein